MDIVVLSGTVNVLIPDKEVTSESINAPAAVTLVESVTSAPASTETPPIVNASVSSVPSMSASPLISNEVASISPLALNATPSPPLTLKDIVLSVPNFIWLSASLPTTKLVFSMEVIPVCDASIPKFSEPSSDKPVPAKSLTSISSVTELPNATEPPFFKPSPAVTDTELFVSDELPIFDKVFEAPLIVLLVKVCVSLVPTTLPVTPCTPLVGLSTSLPCARFDIVLLSASIVLFVSVSVVEVPTIFVVPPPTVPATHLFALTSYNREPVAAPPLVSLTYNPPSLAPAFNSTILSPTSNVVEFTLVSVPDTVKLPLIITWSSNVIVPPAESIVKLPVEVSISPSAVTPTFTFPNVPPAKVGFAPVCIFCGVLNVIVPSVSSVTVIWFEVPLTKLSKSIDTNFLSPFVPTNFEAVKSSNVTLSKVTSADVSIDCGNDNVILPAPLVTVIWLEVPVNVPTVGSPLLSPIKSCPFVNTAVAVMAEVPLPSRTPPSVSDVAPVPPFPTGNVPVTSFAKSISFRVITWLLIVI